MKRNSDAASITLKGNLEINVPCVTEYDKEEFVTALNEQVGYYGLNSLFSIPNMTETIHSLIDNAHIFSLDSVITEHDTRMVHLYPVFELDTNGVSSTTETTKSTVNRFKLYYMYEQYDISISRLLVELLISTTYRETIKTRFSYHDNYDDLPG